FLPRTASASRVQFWAATRSIVAFNLHSLTTALVINRSSAFSGCRTPLCPPRSVTRCPTVHNGAEPFQQEQCLRNENRTCLEDGHRAGSHRNGGTTPAMCRLQDARSPAC